MIASNPKMRYEGPRFIPAGESVRANPRPVKRKQAKKHPRLAAAIRRAHARRNPASGEDISKVLTAGTPLGTELIRAVAGKKPKKEKAYVPSDIGGEEEPASPVPWILGGLGVIAVIGGGIWYMNQPKSAPVGV
jgi:hypothetical protein